MNAENNKKLKNAVLSLLIYYVGRACRSCYKYDETLAATFGALPDGFVFRIGALPAGAGLTIRKDADGITVLDRSDAHASPDLDIRFKNVGTAKMFFNGSKSLAACFSQSQTVTEGDTSHIMTLSRIFDAVASYILTKGILKRNGRELLPRRVSAHKMRFKTLIWRI